MPQWKEQHLDPTVQWFDMTMLWSGQETCIKNAYINSHGITMTFQIGELKGN